jgi:hypothetical protein
LNWLSQGFAYGQDGGVWTWSALADYDIGRIVKGSDGLLYESKAQSGPGLAAGAQDPTADSGTYWQSPTLLTMPLGDKSNAAATTEWVKDYAVARIYLDASTGSDTNDGLNAATPVQTFARALYLAKLSPSTPAVIDVAPGIYAGDLSVNDFECYCFLRGDVSVVGDVTLYDATLGIGSQGYDFKINGHLLIAAMSNFNISGDLYVEATSGTVCETSTASTMYVGGSLYLTAKSAQYVMYGLNAASVIVAASVDITGTTASVGLWGYQNSSIYVGSSLTIHDIAVSGEAVSCGASSALRVCGICTISSTVGTYSILIDENSFARFDNNTSITSVLSVMKGSVFLCFGSQFSVTNNSKSFFNVIVCNDSSFCLFGGQTAIDISSSVHCFDCEVGSCMKLCGLTVSGSFSGYIFLTLDNSCTELASGYTYGGGASGTKYLVARCSSISLNGVDPATLPGTGGSADAASFGYVG